MLTSLREVTLRVAEKVAVTEEESKVLAAYPSASATHLPVQPAIHACHLKLMT